MTALTVPTVPFAVRAAEARDLPRLAQLAGQLVRMHHEADPRRFLLVDRVEEGYGLWFAREIAHAGSVVLVATPANRPDELLGYVYGTIEGRDWNMLLDAHGAVHDVFVEGAVRRSGVGRALVVAMVAALGTRGAPRVVLSTMVSNESAQRLFRGCGFRATMVEMTCELSGPDASSPRATR